MWGGDKGVGGGGAGGGTQGLAHWMSVMAEHMNHETSSLHPAYMWHNGIDQKMSLSEQQQLLNKGECNICQNRSFIRLLFSISENTIKLCLNTVTISLSFS